MNDFLLLTILFVVAMLLAGAVLGKLSRWTDEAKRNVDGD